MKVRSAVLVIAFLVFGFWACHSSVRADDWPTYRADTARTGYSKETLPSGLSLRWVYRSAPAQSAWPSSDRQLFDRAAHPVVAEGVLCFGSSATGKIEAIRADTGESLWSFHTDGPVRVTPVLWEGRVYAVSDDGYLYCIDTKTGQLHWKKRGGPSDEMVLGNDHLTSAWPARGGIAISNGIIYWAAGIWPSDGIFVCALDAESGEEMWKNTEDGFRFMPQPHGGANAKSGFSAQGHIAVHDGRVFLPTGRAVPATLKVDNGKFDYFHLQKYGHNGGTAIVVLGDRFHNDRYFYDANTGLRGEKLAGIVTATEKGVAQATTAKITVLDWAEGIAIDRKGKQTKTRKLSKAWSVDVLGTKCQLISAGSTIVVGAKSQVHVVDTKTKRLAWSHEVQGRAYGLAAANGRLYASTDEGLLYCFEATPDGEKHEVAYPARPQDLPQHDPVWADAADAILSSTKISEGYCVDLGCGDGSLAIELARQSLLQIYCIDEDPKNVAKARERLTRAGLYGTRVTVHHRTLAKTTYPKYFADLIVSQRKYSGEAIPIEKAEVERLTRPWGGVSCLDDPSKATPKTRGPLEGAGSWTHQYSNPGNTCCSDDVLVRGPLKMLWFRDADLPMPQRHGRAPAPLFHRGILVVEGLDAVRASNAYNGRTLWEYSLPGILKPYDQDHLLGTAGTGSNVCVEGDSVYIHRKTHLLQLDLFSGKKTAEFPAPPRPDGKAGTWGYLACVDGIVYGTVANTDHIVKWRYLKGDMSQQFSESFSFFALDPKTGKTLWTYPAQNSISHNPIAIGGGRVYLIDREIAVMDKVDFRREGPKKGDGEESATTHADGELVALEAKTGNVAWRKADKIYGTTLALSVDESALLMGYQPTRFRLASEKGGRMAVFHTKNGYRLWDKDAKYQSRPLINGKTIFSQGGAWDLKTGVERPFPFKRSYGCGILAAGRNLMVFRSATMGYYNFDETSEGAPTHNYGGLRLGCWINALPVGGIVLVPDGSAGCKCSYLNQASIALQSVE